MIKKYNQYIKEGLNNYLSGPSYEEIKKNFEDDLINPIKFYSISKEFGDEKNAYDKIIKKFLTLDNFYDLNVYVEFCSIYNFNYDNDLVKKLLFIGKITLEDFYDYLKFTKTSETILTSDELKEYFNSDNETVNNLLKKHYGRLFEFCEKKNIKEGIDWCYKNGGSDLYNSFKEELNKLEKVNGKEVRYKKNKTVFFSYNIKEREIRFNQNLIDKLENIINDKYNLYYINYGYIVDILKYFFSKEIDAYFQYTFLYR